MDIKIIVAAHKKYAMPGGALYLPLHVGKAGKADIGYAGDDTGDSISAKNANYCELTGLYWAWKNLQADAIGLAHYRRHFTAKGVLGYKLAGKWRSVLTAEQAERLLKDADVILPNKRRYWIESNYGHYMHAHRREGLDIAGEYIRQQSDEYAKAWETVMRRTWAHMFNMFVMKRGALDRYCGWLFDVLAHVEERLDISGYSASEARVFGYVAELLLDVWIEANGAACVEAHAMFMERQNWVGKIAGMVQRKLEQKVKS
jgi:hypothetical protein